ncbi:MAG: HAD-IC family P-type ATPase [Candidatus Omnitrophica bacterium]|nr:HAD-IC family P-type ATPase [Candidatus Omnitrophota bacterium]
MNDQTEKKNWPQVDIKEAAASLDVDLEKGLSEEEIERRKEEYGPNEIAGKKKRSALMRFLDNFKEPLIYILLVAALVSFLIGERVDAAVIFGVALINAIVSFIQESKAENAIYALSKSMVTRAKVIRNGKTIEVASRDIVPGDLVVISSGDKVSSDMRLVETRDLQINEASLTGESVPVSKNTDATPEDTVLGDQTGMAFAGTLVTRGRGKGVVVATGQSTETGRISQMMEDSQSLQTPLTRKIRDFSRKILYIITGMAGLMFFLTIVKGINWTQGFHSAVALAVSAIPEGLPAAITVTLAIGVNRMAKRNAIIRKLPAVEALGSTTVICSDKTGTLTQNRMTVRRFYAGQKMYEFTGGFEEQGDILIGDRKLGEGEDPDLQDCLIAGVLCNDSHLQEKDGKLETSGDPTEGALLIAALKAGEEKEELEKEYPRIDVIPFESEKQYMATLNQAEGRKIVYMKGSLEAVLESCDKALEEQEIIGKASQMADKGFRVLAFARKETDERKERINDNDIKDMVFMGLAGMIDPPREEAVEAIKVAQSAGIKIKMITGDHAQTAGAIAKQMNITGENGVKVYKGKDLSGMSDEDLSGVIENSVFARVAPEHKLRLVKALQSKNEIVAVTGDGVNDAPALQQADIGVAMGIMGTEVAKEAADMILTDDNFASIEAAVEEGRTVYDNILKIIGFILPVNGGEALTVFAGMLFAAVIPILPVQILWVNLVSSVALMLTLAFDPAEKDIMSRKPRPSGESILSKRLLARVITLSVFNLLATFGMFEFIWQTTDDLGLARAAAVNTLVAAEAFYLLSVSRFIPSICERLRGEEVAIAYVPAIGISVVIFLQYFFTQWQPMNALFHTSPLNFMQALGCFAAGVMVLIPALILRRYAPIK